MNAFHSRNISYNFLESNPTARCHLSAVNPKQNALGLTPATGVQSAEVGHGVVKVG